MSQIKISNNILELQENETTYLNTDASNGDTSIAADGLNFSQNDYAVLGKLGVQKSEIIQVNAATPTVITLNSAMVFPHNRGEVVSFIPYNQIVLERSIDGGVTYTPLTPVNIQADNNDTIIQRPSDSATDYYRVRFYNSTTAVYSDYSDPIIGSGYADNTVFSIKRQALETLGEVVGDKITDNFLNRSLWEARRELHNAITRWTFRTKFNSDIGNVLPGAWSVAAPADLNNRNSPQNILEIRIGRTNYPVEYVDNVRFRQNYLNIGHTTLVTPITNGSANLVLTSSGDFDESGNVDIAASSVDQVRDTAAYTANNEITNTLSGVTGIVDTKAAGVDVWQNARFGLPRWYTITAGMIYFDVPFSDDLAGQNIFMDYYSDLLAYDSDSDVLDEPEYDMFVSWLRWKIKYLKSNGALNAEEDGDYKEYKRRSQNLIESEIIGQDIYLIPG